MSPENLRYGGGVAGTVLNPAVAIVLLIAGLLILFLPQRKAVIPFLFTAIVVPGDQIVVVAGLHFPVLRVLLLFGLVRLLMIKGRGQMDLLSGGINKIDKAVFGLALTTAVCGVLLFRNFGAVVFQLGELYTAFCTYFLLRCLVRDREDVYRTIRVFAWIAIFLGVIMTIERVTGTNPYGKLGGARAFFYDSLMERDGKIRATGSFGGPITAGTFGAVLVPLFVGLWLVDKKQRSTAVLGMVGATVMTVACNSSTPLGGYIAGILGLCLWPFRGLMRLIRWGIVVTLVSLHMVMKAPVWQLIARIDLTGGNSGDHRYQLINQSIIHFWEWWLIGTRNSGAWGWDMWDLCDQYVVAAVNSGLLGVILFIAIIVYGFKYLGKARNATTDKKQALFFWAMSSALFAHVISFLGIGYWDQTIVAWYALLVMISAVAVPRKVAVAAPKWEDLEPATEAAGFVPGEQLASRRF